MKKENKMFFKQYSKPILENELFRVITPREYVLISVMACFMDSGRTCFPSQKLLAYKSNLKSISTVSALIKGLLNKKFLGSPILTIKKKKGKRGFMKNEYTLSNKIGLAVFNELESSLILEINKHSENDTLNNDSSKSDNNYIQQRNNNQGNKNIHKENDKGNAPISVNIKVEVKILLEEINKYLRTKYKVNAKILNLYRKAVQGGYNLKQIVNIVDNTAASDWMMGGNDEGKVYLSPYYILQDQVLERGW